MDRRKQHLIHSCTDGLNVTALKLREILASVPICGEAVYAHKKFKVPFGNFYLSPKQTNMHKKNGIVVSSWLFAHPTDVG